MGALGDYFASGYKVEFPDHAQELIAGRAQVLLKKGGTTPEDVAKILRDECTAEDGTPQVTTAEIRAAIAAALSGLRLEMDPSLEGKLLVGSERIEAAPDGHIEAFADEVRGWKNLDGLGFGIYELDRAYGGLYPKETMALVGAPGSMKTSLALNAVNHYLSNNEGRVLFFSLDMPAGKVAVRWYMRELDRSEPEVYHMWQSHDPEFEEAKKRLNAWERGRFRLVGKPKGGRHYSWDNLRNIVIQTGPELVIIDYLTCIGDYKSELEAVRDLMPKICSLAEDFGLAVILLSQMGRGSRAAQKMSSGGHAAGGHYVEDAVDVEIELLKQLDEAGKTNFIASVTKTRKAAAGRSFRLDFTPWTMEFRSTCTEVHRSAKPQKIFEI